MSSHYGEKESDRLAQRQSLSPLLLSHDSLETKDGTPGCCQAACWMDSVPKVRRDATWNVFALLQTRNSQVLKCSKTPFGCLCV